MGEQAAGRRVLAGWLAYFAGSEKQTEQRSSRHQQHPLALHAQHTAPAQRASPTRTALHGTTRQHSL